MSTTIKIPYSTTSICHLFIKETIINQNNCVRFMFNRINEHPDISQKESTALINSMNNIFVDSWFKQSAVVNARSIYDSSIKNKNKKVIFGSKKLFQLRNKDKISKSEYQDKKLMDLYIEGEKLKDGNRKFELKIIENNIIIFKFDKDIHIELKLPKLNNNYKKILTKLQMAAEQKLTPFTISMSMKEINISFDEKILKQKEYQPIKNRTSQVDLNPNYIGFSITDWINEDEFKVLYSEVISFKEINDKIKALKVASNDLESKYWNNKKEHEIFEVSKRLSEISKHFQVEYFGIEDLSIDSKDQGKGVAYNRLINNLWCRGKFISNLFKRHEIIGIKSKEIFPEYSSFIGNILNRNQPDQVASSIEIGRRLYKLVNGIKNVRYPDFNRYKESAKQSLEELFGSIVDFDLLKSWVSLYNRVKTLKNYMRYRVPLEEYQKVFRLFDYTLCHQR